MNQGKGPEIIAVGGGKGGVGKSFIAAGLATSLAGRGHDTVIVDLDLGGANVHTLLGIRHPETGIGDYIYRPHSRDLLDYVTETGTEGLKLISGYGFIPGIANLNYFQKLKVIRAISRLKNDYIILDLGAGTSYNVVDFFSMTKSGVIVTNAEPTAVLNAYEFIKNVLFRMIEKQFRKKKELQQLVKTHKKPEGNRDTGPTIDQLVKKISSVDSRSAEAVREICRSFTPALIINMATGPVDTLSSKLRAICRQFLSIDVSVLDAVPADEDARACLLRMQHVLAENPDAPSSRAICDIAEKFLEGELRIGRKAYDVALSNSEADARLISGDREDIELAALISDFFVGFGNKSCTYADAEAETEETLLPDQCINLDFRFDMQVLTPRFMPFDEMLQDQDDSAANDSALARIMAIADAEDAILAITNQDELKIKSDEVGRAWLKCGYSLLASHQQKSAFKAFMRAYRLIPEILPASVSAAAALISSDRPLDALKIIDRALERFSDHPLLLYNHALAALRLEQYAGSAGAVEKLSRTRALDAGTMAIGAVAAFKLKRYSAAVKFMNSMNGSGPWKPEIVTWNRAVALIMQGRHEKSVKLLDDLISMNPGDSAAFAARGAALWKMQDRDAALADFNRAVQLKTFDISYRAARGTAAFHAGLLDKAIGDIEIIARLRPDNVKFRTLLRAIQAQMNA